LFDELKPLLTGAAPTPPYELEIGIGGAVREAANGILLLYDESRFMVDYTGIEAS
jgi:hypothetical protein